MAEKLKTYGSGQVLFKQNEKGGDLFFIKAGQVELSVREESTGVEAVVATLGDKSVIGTMSFLEGDPRSATAKCKTEVKCFVISQMQRDKLLATVPTWFKVLVKDLAFNLRRTNENFVKSKGDFEIQTKKLHNRDQQIQTLESDNQKLKQEVNDLQKTQTDLKLEITRLKKALDAASKPAK